MTLYYCYMQDRAHATMQRTLQPLPDSAFVASARDSIPAANVTTAMARGSVRGRGNARGRSTARGAAATRGTGRGKKRKNEASSSTSVPATGRPSTPTNVPATRRASTSTNVPATGRASWLLFGDALPDLNEELPE